MKKLLIISIICAVYSSCRIPTFRYQRELYDTLNLTEIKIDTTYELYLRTICMDQDNRPIDCFKNPKDTVEVGYIILSEDREKVLVINNNPNRNQKFFKKEKIVRRSPAVDLTEINVFYFKQFRYGNVDGNSNSLQFIFDTAEKDSRTFLWTCVPAGDTLEISSVAEVLPDGLNSRSTSSSLYLVPKFLKSDHFKFVFRVPGSPADTTLSNPCRIFVRTVSKKDYVTYFEFEKPVHHNNRVIRFGKKRLYAFTP